MTITIRVLRSLISCAISSSRRILLSLFDGKTDILFLCSSVYWAGVDGSIKRFIADNKDKTGLLVNVSTAAMKESTYAHIKKIAEKNGVRVSGEEFHCRGKFTALHQCNPDDADIAAVKAWLRIFDEADELGISFILLAGGEPMIRIQSISRPSRCKNKRRYR